MSQENVEIVRGFFERFARGDFSAFDDLPEDYEFVASPEMPDAGAYRGAAALRFIKDWVSSFEDLTMSATEIIDAGGDKVVVGLVQRGRPRGSQEIVEGEWWQIVTLRGGEVRRAETLPKREQALQVAGLRE